MGLENSFRRGIMPLVILSLLKRGDMYGYQLVQETEKQSGGRIKTQEGSLYPVLYKLQEQGLISDKKVLVGKRMTRIYYHLEPDGEQRLKELIWEYEELSRGVLQITGGGADVALYSGAVVSVEAQLGTSMQPEAEEQNSGQGGTGRLGVCFGTP